MNELLLLLSLMNFSPEMKQEAKPAIEKRLTLKKGATLKETLIAFGKPYSASEEISYADGHQYLQLVYLNDVCSGSSCSVIIENQMVVRFVNIKPELIL